MSGTNTKNIGQVVGLFIGTTPPTNTTLIWYDETPNQRCHKVYNPTTKLWQALDPDIISITTYSELVNNAKKNGLVIGKQYQIRDRNDVLATSITPTKVHYIDNSGNILIDDLGTNIQYHVISSNILIDDISGVLDLPTKKLLFSFDEETPNFNVDFLLGKVRKGTKWALAKFKLSSLLSVKSQNSLEWKNGFYFSFANAIKNNLDKDGGVVSVNTYNKKISQLDLAIKNASKENQSIEQNAKNAVTEGTKDSAIYDKKLPINIDTTVTPGDIQKNDTLKVIVSKMQRWINKFKYATGIRLSRSFAEAENMQYINNNDTVESAFSKVQYYLKRPAEISSIDDVEDKSKKYENIDDNQTVFAPSNNNTILDAFAKIRAFFLNISHNIRLTPEFEPEDYNTDVELPKAGDSLEEAFAKAVAKLNQIGFISNGVIESRQRNIFDDLKRETPKMRLDLNKGMVTLRGNGSDIATRDNKKDFIEITPSQIQIGNDGNIMEPPLTINNKTFEYIGSGSNYQGVGNLSVSDANGLRLFTSAAFLSKGGIALTAKNSKSNEYISYDAYFGCMKIGGLTLDTRIVENNTADIPANVSMISCNSNVVNVNVYLPEDAGDGRVLFAHCSSDATITIQARGSNAIDKTTSYVSSITLNKRGQIYMFIFNKHAHSVDGVYHGIWSYSILPH